MLKTTISLREVKENPGRNIPENEKSFRLDICNPFDNQLQEIMFEKDGSFRKEMPVSGTQDIYLYLNDAVTLFSYPGNAGTPFQAGCQRSRRTVFHLDGRERKKGFPKRLKRESGVFRLLGGRLRPLPV